MRGVGNESAPAEAKLKKESAICISELHGDNENLRSMLPLHNMIIII